MIRLIAVAAFALAAATSAQAMTLAPLHQSDGMRTQAQYVGYRHRGVARGYGVFRPYGYGAHRRYGYLRNGYYGYGYYGYGGFRPYGYGVFRPYGYGVWPFRSGVAGRQVRRCALWGAGDVCRRWYY